MEPTHYAVANSGKAVFVKEADFFKSQGGLTKEWGKNWIPIVAITIGDARRQAAAKFGIELSTIYRDEE